MPITTCPTALLCAAAIALPCAGCGSATGTGGAAVADIASAAAIWFQPLPGAAAWPNGPAGMGSQDYLDLFEPDSPWPRAMAKTQVLGLYAGWVIAASDQDLEATVDFINAHQMGIELEAPALQALQRCGDGVEGYVSSGSSVQSVTLAYLRRLQAFGGQVQFLKVDEPYYFGSVVNDPRSCHFSAAEVATQVGQFVQLVRSVYPNAVVGDVEPVIDAAYTPDAVTALGQWQDVYQTVTGTPFPFFIADMNFSDPAWPTLALALEGNTRRRGMQFGIIYIGDPQDVSDAEWSGKAVSRFQTYQGLYQGRPDFVLFQSWEVHPEHCLPETDSSSFTAVIDAYLDAMT